MLQLFKNLLMIVSCFLTFTIYGQNDYELSLYKNVVNDRSTQEEYAFKPSDAIHALFYGPVSLKKFLNGQGVLSFTIESEATKEYATIDFSPSSIALTQNQYSFSLVPETFDLTDQNQINVIKLFGKLGKGKHKINIYNNGAYDNLVYSFTLDIATGTNRFSQFYHVLSATNTSLK